MRLFLFLAGLSLIASGRAEEQVFESSRTTPVLLELFTSEGCSSCPPADRQLRELKSSPELFKTLFPVAYHVNYWDQLGWKDLYAHPLHTALQEKLATYAHVGLYTPAFFKNAKPIGHRGESLNPEPTPPLGLKFSVRSNGDWEGMITKGNLGEKLELQLVRLRFDLQSSVNRGENAGETLKHDFVADQVQFIPLESSLPEIKISGSLKIPTSERSAVLFIVRNVATSNPLQVTGGWMNRS